MTPQTPLRIALVPAATVRFRVRLENHVRVFLKRETNIAYIKHIKHIFVYHRYYSFKKVSPCRGGRSTRAHRAKTRDVAAVSRRSLEYFSVTCAKRNFKSLTFI